MTEFTITEDFPRSEVEFHECFSDPRACYAYLLNKKGQTALFVKGAIIISTGSVGEICTSALNANISTL
jgi:hypothetical protein